jgi:hypothetical protein
MMGCGGDQNPYPRGKVEHTAMHGRSLATSVEAALMPKAVPLHGPLRCAYDEATLDFAPVDKAKLLVESNSKNIYEARHAKRVLADLEAGTLRTTVQFPVQAVRFGDQLTFIGFAGETVVDYALRMKREIPSPHIWVAGYCNDVFGYVPSLRVLKEGGYEGGGAMNFTSFPGPFADTVEDRIIAKAQEVLAKVGITTTTASSHSQ